MIRSFRYFLLLAIASIFLMGCRKAEVAPSPLGLMPYHFMHRVMMEELTAEWCPTCPYGDSVLTQISQQFGDSVVIVAVHWQDFLDKATIYHMIIDSFGQTNGYFPSAAINRVQDLTGTDFWYGKADWTTGIQTQLRTDHQCGIALISSIQGDSATIEVHVGFHSTNDYDMRLNVYLIENNIPQESQDGGYPGYIHRNVLRTIVTPTLGDPISMTVSNEIIRKYKVSLRGFNSANLVFAAFLEKWNSSPTDRQIYNARQIAIGQTAVWQ